MAMDNFLSELKRRHVYRAGGAYAVVAFGLIEIVSNVTPMLDLPAWFGRALILVLIVGFPLTLLAAWMIEAKPADGGQGPSTSKLDFVLAGALVLVVGLLVYQQVAPAQKGAVNVASAEGVSVAVLPFVNLSGDPAQEFFSDGMTEEITSALAKVKGLKVVARTSAFQFKGENKDMRAVGQALGASILLEGSVRKAGNRVRITGQLIKATDGTHVWTENYDRELTDIFATQDDIARAIAAALQAPLGLKQGETLVANRDIDLESYQRYLQAKALFRARGVRGQKGVTAAVGLLESVVERNPGYAPAWALLAMAYGHAPQEAEGYRPGSDQQEAFRRMADDFLAKADAAARRALELDPRSADSYAAAAAVRMFAFQPAQMEDLYRQALKLDPLHPDALEGLAQQLAAHGRLKEAVPLYEQLLTFESQVPRFNVSAAGVLLMSGRVSAALALAQSLPDGLAGKGNVLAQTYAALGRYKDASDAMQNWRSTFGLPAEAEKAARVLARAPLRTAPPDLPEINGGTTFVYFYVGAPERAAAGLLEFIEANLGDSYNRVSPSATLNLLLDPNYAATRKTARFKELVRKLGYVDYWRARGWPDLCRPVGADDFECS